MFRLAPRPGNRIVVFVLNMLLLLSTAYVLREIALHLCSS